MNGLITPSEIRMPLARSGLTATLTATSSAALAPGLCRRLAFPAALPSRAGCMRFPSHAVSQ